MTTHILVGDEMAARFRSYKTAQESKVRWAAEEKALKEEIMISLGYELGEPKPVGCKAVHAQTGEELFEVRVSDRKGVDMAYLRKTYPNVVAEAERISHPISIKGSP